ncbi:hypothetical protein HYU40_02560 [Candidatus Woesearchaeota archaeon]|nr:hypothetical protein [Candidatus Woesearchaeota archaeon]
MIEKSDLAYIFTGIAAFAAVFSANNVAVQVIGGMFIALVIMLYVSGDQNRKINKRLDELERRFEDETHKR